MSRIERGWGAAWTTSPQRPGVSVEPNWSAEGFQGHTLRQTVRLSRGGDALRIRLSNRYGTVPLRVAGLTVAVGAGGAAVKSDTLRLATVDGRRRFTVPAGAGVATDAVSIRTGAFDPVAVTMYLAESSGPATYHAQAIATTHRAVGEHLDDGDGAVFTETSTSWY